MVKQSAGDENFQKGVSSVWSYSEDSVSRPTADRSDVKDPLGFAGDMADFALSLHESTDDTSELILHQIVEGAVSIIPHVAHAAILTPAGPRRLQARASSGGRLPEKILELQNEFGTGPCLDALESHEQIRADDLAVDPRWPGFVEPAAEAGAAGMLSTPLLVGGDTIGVLTLISATPGFDDEAESLARIFAAHAAIALSGVQRNRDMMAALTNRDVIGQAKGILMERFKLTPDLAFAALVRVSTNSNVKLRTVCEELCLTGSLPEERRSRASGGSNGRVDATVAADASRG
ncbi:transcriptional regulator with GAF, ATPase, and Fis domain [Nakamurella sp. UYEF19]|uniref:GAF and ANTAR domain-containing protein n=1 Tax=Nakamurella sp. UYEF19 TaxID=1756392 RepID=UPI003398DFDE